MTPEIEALKEALTTAREATNGWACYARTKMEHAEIARLHLVIDAAHASLTALQNATTHSGRSLRDSIEAYRAELLESNPPVAHVLGMLLEECE